MTYPAINLAQSIIEICKSKQIKNIVISPGSRNAPLTIGFVSDPYFTCYSIADERCAGFFALGISQQNNTPTALVCTSGSALLNYYPSIAEAFYSQIPLVVISADRPTNKIDIGDGQTIRQANVFANHIIYSANLTQQSSAQNDLEINKALDFACAKKGPTHINAPFEEPLYNTVEQLQVCPVITQHNCAVEPKVDYPLYASKWNAAAKKLVLVGSNPPDVIEQHVLDLLANDPSVVVFTEVSSNFHHPSFIAHIDRIITTLSKEDFTALQPDILVTFSGMVVSKRIKNFLRNYPAQQHWHIDTQRHYDTYGILSDSIFDTPNHFFQHISRYTRNYTQGNYHTLAWELAQKKQQAHQRFMATIPYSDLFVMQAIFQHLPQHSDLQISNSSAIRYAQLLPVDPTVKVFCNRGTSGIDGSTSTAIGAAVASERPTILLTGDVSFFYDSNALWNAYVPKDFKIILINNQGGGIFRILPGHQQTPLFNTFFETQHQLTAQHLAQMYGWNYTVIHDNKNIDSVLGDFFAIQNTPSILEITTPTTVNDKVLKDYFNNM